VAWVPALLAGISPGTSLCIRGAKPDKRGVGRGYSLDEKSSVEITNKAIEVPFSPLITVSDGGIYSVKGEVKEVKEPRSFTSRNGSASWVRNILISDGNDDLRIVLWGENALLSVHPGDVIEIYHATAKPGRFGGIELGVGRGSSLRLPKDETRPIVFQGTIISGQGCTFIDNGAERYLIEGDFPHGIEMQVTGTLSGSRIIPEDARTIDLKPEPVRVQLQNFIQELDS
jgi:replication factor A1